MGKIIIMNKSEIIFKSFVNLLKLNFNEVLTIRRVNTKWYNRRKLRSCDFIVKINSGGTLLKCAVEIKSVGFDIYSKLKKEIQPASFICSPSKDLIDSINKASEQLKNVAKDRFPSILLLYPCPELHNVAIDDKIIDKWMQFEDMNKGCLKKYPHINGIALLDIYTGKILLHFYKNPYSTIPMGWEYNILFDDIKEYAKEKK